jgi:hypothetical protein
VKAQDKFRFSQDESLNTATIWKQYCEIHDEEFAKQAKRLDFWKGYDKIEYKQLPSEALLDPSVSYRSALRFIR